MLAFFSLYPLDKGESLSKYVARSLDIIDKSGLDYQLTSMGTMVEGEPDEIWGLLKDCHAKMREVSDRIAFYIKIDDRVGKTGRLKGKAASVEGKRRQAVKMSAALSKLAGPVLIVGGGDVACRAVEVAREAGADVFLVDRRSSCKARHLVPDDRFTKAGIDESLGLAEEIKPLWVIPAVPRHLAAQWLIRRWPALAPDPAEWSSFRPWFPSDILLPGDPSSATFLLSLSPPGQICPTACLPPGDCCALTGEPRDASLVERISEALAGRTCEAFIFESCQVAPGLGAMRWSDLSNMLSSDQPAAGSTVAVVTASACHGVGNIFRVMKNVVE